MSENPRLWLAGMWFLMWLRVTSAALDSHTAVTLVGNLLGVVVCPILAYSEMRRGLKDRRQRLEVGR